MCASKFLPSLPMAAFVQHYWVWERASSSTERQPKATDVPVPPRTIIFSDPCQTSFFADSALQPLDKWLPLKYVPDYLCLEGRNEAGGFGVQFKAAGFYQLFGVALLAATGSALAPEGAVSGFVRELMKQLHTAKTPVACAQACEELLRARLRHVQPRLGATNFVADQIQRRHGQVNIDALAHAVNLSKRQLERQFHQKVGVTPKHYARLARFNYVFQILEDEVATNWVDVALRCGYYDQAHFIREFRRYTGESPAAYFHHQNLSPRFLRAA